MDRENMDRDKTIIRTSILNVVANVVLAIAKGFAGMVTGSVAIMLDAVNSLTDALGSIVAVIGTKLAGKSSSFKHPFGFGRFEYLASIVIGALILSAGLSSLGEAVRSIMNPSTPSYDVVSLTIVAVAAVIKFGMGVYMLRTGKRLDSGVLIGNGTDSLMDGGVSVATFLAGIIYILLGLQIESWLAAAIALLIIKNGVSILIETSSKLLGERMDPEVSEKVELEARAVDEVKLANGLLLLDFGPQFTVGAIHVTVDKDMTVAEFDNVARRVQERVRDETGVILAGVTPYPYVKESGEAARIRDVVGRIVWNYEGIADLRGLYVDEGTSTVRFDAIMSFGDKGYMRHRDRIVEECEAQCPGWKFDVRVIPHMGD